MVFNRFSKTLIQLKSVESGNLGRKFQVLRYFTFAMPRWKLSPSTRSEIFYFQPVNGTSKYPISPKVFNRFSKTLLHVKRVESGHFGRKYQVRMYFSFAMARWKLRPSTRVEIFQFQTVNRTSKNTVSPKLFNRFSKTLLHLKRVEIGSLGRKFQVRRYFTFAMTRWILSPSKRFEISHIQPVNCPVKNPISPKRFKRFSKTFLHLKRYECGHLGPKFQVRRYFTFAMARWKLSPSRRFEISLFQPVNCTGKNPISPKGFKRFSKTLLHLQRVESGHLGRKFQVRRYFILQLQGENLAHRQDLKFHTFNL